MCFRFSKRTFRKVRLSCSLSSLGKYASESARRGYLSRILSPVSIMATSSLRSLDDTDDFVDFALRVYDVASGNVYRIPRLMRDRGNPMEHYDETEFCIRYRFSKTTVCRLLELLPMQESADGRGIPVPPMLRLLTALRFYGAATFQRETGDLIGLSQATTCRVIAEVSEAISRTLFPLLVRFPDPSQMREVMHDFYKIAQFPGVTGCIDCTHVRIKSPGGDDAEVFRNRKGVFSINVQVSFFTSKNVKH